MEKVDFFGTLFSVWGWNGGEANKVAFTDWWTEVVAQRTENGGGMEGGASGARGGEQQRHGALPMQA
jgi:hypothetical protein